ncbi:hypothetical protein INT80_10805 [Gallibacterium anatis]|uniref:Uncharacterized protein n=1 Tax=Gallibacterium anatis TaxID=750 RepID=A0A930UY22_9PAST|nr:hypothetical protein [Gallibacterium anatis]
MNYYQQPNDNNLSYHKIIDNKDLPKGKFKGKRITKEGVIANSSEEVTSELRDWNNTAIYNDTACN